MKRIPLVCLKLMCGVAGLAGNIRQDRFKARPQLVSPTLVGSACGATAMRPTLGEMEIQTPFGSGGYTFNARQTLVFGNATTLIQLLQLQKACLLSL